MSNAAVVKFTVVGVFLVSAAVGTYTLFERLEEPAIHIIVGGVAVLTIVVVVGLLFVVKDLLQAYIMRRMLAQDDYNDLKQMAMIARLTGRRSPGVYFRMPNKQQGVVPWPMLMGGSTSAQNWDFDGVYRDTLTDSEIEIE